MKSGTKNQICKVQISLTPDKLFAKPIVVPKLLGRQGLESQAEPRVHYQLTDTEKSHGVNSCNNLARSSDLFHSLPFRMEHTPEPCLTMKLKQATATPCKWHKSRDLLFCTSHRGLNYPPQKESPASSCALRIPLFCNTKAITQPWLPRSLPLFSSVSFTLYLHDHQSCAINAKISRTSAIVFYFFLPYHTLILLSMWW